MSNLWFHIPIQVRNKHRNIWISHGNEILVSSSRWSVICPPIARGQRMMHMHMQVVRDKDEKWSKWLKFKTLVLLIDSLTGRLLQNKCKICFRELFSMGESCTTMPLLCTNWQHNLNVLSSSSLRFRLLWCLGQELDLSQMVMSVSIVLRLISGSFDSTVYIFHY